MKVGKQAASFCSLGVRDRRHDIAGIICLYRRFVYRSLQGIWQAISELQSKIDPLQAQIDYLKAQRVAVAPEQADTKVSDPSIGIEVGPGEAGQTLLTLTAKNADPENAVGVKLSTYYQTTLFHVNSIQGAGRTDRAGGGGG